MQPCPDLDSLALSPRERASLDFVALLPEGCAFRAWIACLAEESASESAAECAPASAPDPLARLVALGVLHLRTDLGDTLDMSPDLRARFAHELEAEPSRGEALERAFEEHLRSERLPACRLAVIEPGLYGELRALLRLACAWKGSRRALLAARVLLAIAEPITMIEKPLQIRELIEKCIASEVFDRLSIRERAELLERHAKASAALELRAEACEAWRRAIEFRRSRTPSAHGAMAAAWRAIAELLRPSEDPADKVARLHASERAVAELEAAPPEHRRDLVWALHDLASAREEAGDLEGARAMLERELALRLERSYPGNWDFHLTYSALSSLADKMGELESAIAWKEKEIDVLEGCLQSGLGDISSANGELVSMIQLQGDEAIRIRHAPRALVAIEREMALRSVFSARPERPERPDWFARPGRAEREIRSRVSLSSTRSDILRDLGRLPEALEWKLRALSIHEAELPHKRRDLARLLLDLAEILRDLGRLEEARDHLVRAIAIQTEERLDASTTAFAWSSLAGVQRAIGAAEDAAASDRKAVSYHRESLRWVEEECPSHLRVRERNYKTRSLAEALETIGELEEARVHLARAVEEAVAHPDLEWELRAGAFEDAARNAAARGDAAEAERHSRAARAIHRLHDSESAAGGADA